MKRCWLKSAPLMVLILTSLLFLPSCGMPTYLSLDNNITWNDKDGITGSDKIHWSFALSPAGLSEVHDKVDQAYPPAIKLFYALSNETAVVIPEMSISFVRSRFDSYIKRESSGDGRPWIAESSSKAPGFYLYSPNLTSIDPASIQRPQEEVLNLDSKRVVLGTFAFSPLATDGAAQRYFNDSPSMDIPMDWNSGTLEFSISRIGTDLELLYGKKDNVLTEKFYLWDYQKLPLPIDGSINEYSRNLENDSNDGTFWSYLDVSANDLYLHVYASLHGGAGFTNTYWSKLQYLGYIPIPSSN